MVQLSFIVSWWDGRERLRFALVDATLLLSDSDFTVMYFVETANSNKPITRSDGSTIGYQIFFPIHSHNHHCWPTEGLTKKKAAWRIDHC